VLVGKRFTLELTPEMRAFYSEASRRRRRVRVPCVVCGAEIEGTTRRRYCSARCSQRAYRERRGEVLAPMAPAPPVAPAVVAAAATPLQPGDRVVVVRDLGFVPEGATGTIERLVGDGHATVRWDRYPRELHVPLNRLQRVQPPTP